MINKINLSKNNKFCAKEIHFFDTAKYFYKKNEYLTNFNF